VVELDRPERLVVLVAVPMVTTVCAVAGNTQKKISVAATAAIIFFFTKRINLND
jgi:hypothetical protein